MVACIQESIAITLGRPTAKLASCPVNQPSEPLSPVWRARSHAASPAPAPAPAPTDWLAALADERAEWMTMIGRLGGRRVWGRSRGTPACLHDLDPALPCRLPPHRHARQHGVQCARCLHTYQHAQAHAAKLTSQTQVGLAAQHEGHASNRGTSPRSEEARRSVGVAKGRGRALWGDDTAEHTESGRTGRGRAGRGHKRPISS